MRIIHNIRWGLKHSFNFAGLAILWVTFTHFILGADFQSEVHMSYLALVLFYICAGLLTGVILGLLRPITVRRAGAAGTGFVLAAMIYGSGATMYIGPPWQWDSIAWVLITLMSALGIPVGISRWKKAPAGMTSNG